jgi:MFS family permease
MVTELVMIRSYLRLLNTPSVARLLVIALLTRLTTPVLSLALMIVVYEERRSYQVAGLVLTVHALSLAAITPPAGRLADRHGPRRTLTGFLLAHTAAWALLLAALSTPVPAGILVAAAALLGGTSPPAGSVTRAAWPRLVPAESLHTAYALDSATNELMFVAGPVLVAALLLVMPAHLIVALSGTAFLAGVLLLIRLPAVGRSTDPDRTSKPGRWRARLLGPLQHGPTLVVLCAAALATFAFGSIRVATLASATAFGSPAYAGLLMALLSAGTVAGGLAYGARRWPLNGRHTLILLCLADAAILAADAFAPTLAALAVLVAVTGLLSGPRETLQPSLLAAHADHRHRTEVFAWLNTFMWAGYGAGTAVAGHLTTPTDTGAKAFVSAAVAAAVAAAVVTAAYRPGPATPDEKQTHLEPAPAGSTDAGRAG